jgi:TatD DNase family protein
VIDFHCHLDLYPDPQEVAARCVERGLYVLSVTTTPSAWRATTALEGGSRRIRTALGLHPQLAHERMSELPLFDEFLGQTKYVGEVGLDGSPEFKAHWPAQLAAFTHILGACARTGGRIMSIHSRRAARQVLDLLESHPGAGAPVLHWFSGSQRELRRAVGLGCWFSVGPAMLRGARGRELAALMPRDRIVTESDGPFAQVGDAPLMPWQAGDALAVLAELWSTTATVAENLVHGNLRTLLGTTSVPAVTPSVDPVIP